MAKQRRSSSSSASHERSDPEDSKVPAMQPGVALQKARALVENGSIVINTGHIRKQHQGERIGSHVFDFQDIYNVLKSSSTSATRNEPDFFKPHLNAFVYQARGVSAGDPIRVVFYFTQDPDGSLLLQILTAFMDVPEHKKRK